MKGKGDVCLSLLRRDSLKGYNTRAPFHKGENVVCCNAKRAKKGFSWRSTETLRREGGMKRIVINVL